MSHALRTDIPLLPAGPDDVEPQAVFELDTGDLVALRMTTATTPMTTLECVARAWLVDAQGDLQAVAGNPVQSGFTHTADVTQIAALGVQGIADALRDLVLGEAAAEPPPIPWGDALRAQVSIRNVITIARAAGTPIDWSATP